MTTQMKGIEITDSDALSTFARSWLDVRGKGLQNYEKIDPAEFKTITDLGTPVQEI